MTQIASHRGGAILWPENSPTAFRQTALLPVEQVEFDIHLTADDAVVVIHDATLERTTEARGPVRALPLSALRRVRLKGAAGETVPTLEEVATLFRPTPLGLRMELKTGLADDRYPGLAEKAAAVLQQAGMLARTTVTSFRLELAAEAAPHFGGGGLWLVSRATLGDSGLPGVVAAAREAGIGGIGLHAADCDADAVAEGTAAGLAVGAWAVNDAEAIRRMFNLGVAVFTTDDPVAASRLRASGGRR